MKAYRATDRRSFEDFATIVFAHNPSGAKKVAMHSEAFEDSCYLDIRVRREPLADGLYQGKSEIDWYDQDTRLFLVKHLSWACIEPSWECDTCKAKPYCLYHDEEEN